MGSLRSHGGRKFVVGKLSTLNVMLLGLLLVLLMGACISGTTLHIFFKVSQLLASTKLTCTIPSMGFSSMRMAQKELFPPPRPSTM